MADHERVEETISKATPYKLPTASQWYPVSSSFYHPLQAGSIDGTDVVPHDNGVIRAVLSSYRPNKLVRGDPDRTLFIGRLDKSAKEGKLKNLFEDFGAIKRFRLVRDVITGSSRGYAFVEFERERDARTACREMHRAIVDGREILVDFECERQLKGWIPRRFGGGFGGNKESGQLRFGGKGRPFRRPIDLNKNPMRQQGYQAERGGGARWNQSQYNNHGNRSASRNRGDHQESF